MNLTRFFSQLGAFAVLNLALSTSSPAATIVVTTTNDSGAGSLRQAIITANGTVNVADTITFNIPNAGPHTITPATPLSNLTDRVVIDGYTQSGSSSNTLPAGDNAVLQIVLQGRLIFDTTNSTIRGLALQQIQIGQAPGPKGGNTVEGCFIGLDATGTNSLASPGPGIFVETPNNRIGGTNPGARNIIAGQGTTGIEIFQNFAISNLAQGNFIGTDRAGTRAIGNTDRAFVVNMDASFTTIGGSVAGAGNLISGNLNRGITLDGSNNIVQGNFIGTDVTGTLPLGNGKAGVEIGGGGNLVGGTNAGTGNIIAFNGVDASPTFTTNGVDVKAGTTSYSILGNSIFDNHGLGIDVNANGLPTAGYPGLTVVSNTGTATMIRGTNAASTAYRLELFSNPTIDASGFGEGKTLLLSTNVTTDGTGNFTLTWPVALSPGLLVAATTTAAGTSEFSKTVGVTAVGGPNSWKSSGGGKWEDGTNWLLNVAPFFGQPTISITNAGTKTVTNDIATVNNAPGSLSISNLVIGAPVGATNTLLIAHGGTNTPVHVLKSLYITNGGAMVISNAAVTLDGPGSSYSHINGALTLVDGLLSTTNNQFYIGSTNPGTFTVAGGNFRAYYPIVGSITNGTWNITGGTNTIKGVVDIADNLGCTGILKMTGGQLTTPGIYVGLFGNGNLIVSNGSFTCTGQGLIGSQPGSVGNFTAAGGTSTFGTIITGDDLSSTGAIVVTNSALVRVNNQLEQRNNAIITVAGGSLIVTNDSSFLTRLTVSNGIYMGSNVYVGGQGGQGGSNGIVRLEGGTLSASNLIVNATSQVILNGGLLQTRLSTNANNSLFVVGNGVKAAEYQVLGSPNWFLKGLVVTNHATLSGNGAIQSDVTNLPGSTFSPGVSGIGTLVVQTSLTLLGTTYMELNRQTAQNDYVQGLLNVKYGGTLVVSNLAGTLVPGDQFTLFSSVFSSGNFTNIVNQTGNNAIAFTFNPANGILRVDAYIADYPTNLTFSRAGTNLLISWPTTHLGWILQSQTNALNVGLQNNVNAWMNIAGTRNVTATNILIKPTNSSVFYRLSYPVD